MLRKSPKHKKVTQIDSSQQTLSGWLSKSPSAKRDVNVTTKLKQPNLSSEKLNKPTTSSQDIKKQSHVKTKSSKRRIRRLISESSDDDLPTFTEATHDDNHKKRKRETPVQETKSEHLVSSTSSIKNNNNSKCPINKTSPSITNFLETFYTSEEIAKMRSREKTEEQDADNRTSNNTEKRTNVAKKIEKPSHKHASDKKSSGKRSNKTEKTEKQHGNPSGKKSNITKKAPIKTLRRFNSASSDELPIFNKKVPRKRNKQTEAFKKYGVMVPQVDEIIADQQQLSNYKSQVQEAQALKEPSFKLPISPMKVKVEERLLDCKHLSLNDISRHFNDNISLLSDIMQGKKFSDRHRRYYDKNSVVDRLTVKDLTYSTSTIVFSFEQIDYMISLMREKFDPEDVKTSYFFKVLVPELCLKVFMDTFDMNKREATKYLDNRPI